MPRYIVDRSFLDRFEIPAGIAGVGVCRGLIETNEEVGVTWIHSYVRDDHRAMFCLYDAPTPRHPPRLRAQPPTCGADHPRDRPESLLLRNARRGSGKGVTCP
jgi:hypothetical protein